MIVLSLVMVQLAFGQSDAEIARAKCEEAIQLMDNGKVDESIVLLKEAQKLDSKSMTYPYEMAFAHYLKEDYKESVQILEKLLKHPDVTEIVYQLLGNSYDMLGKPDKALKTYDAGLKKFPTSGALYLEKGNVYWLQKEYDQALPFYEKGIEVAPTFPSNYYRAAIIYCNSDEEVWGMVYGETFINLERNTQRTADISALLYETYKDGIIFANDTTVAVSFCRNTVITLDELQALKIPFGSAYESTLLLSVADEKSIDLNSLDRIRTRFLEEYYHLKYNEQYPFALFDYQNKLKTAGHLEAYNHWILMAGDEEAFAKWMADNARKWDDFVKWFNENQFAE